MSVAADIGFVIDLERDELTPVAPLVERTCGRRISPPTLWRWRVQGVRGVKLECYLIAGKWCTTSAALAEFIRASSAAATPQAPPLEGDARERLPKTERRLRERGLLRDS